MAITNSDKIRSSKIPVAGIYEKNMDALGRHHAGLKEIIESAVIDNGRIEVLHADNGAPRVIYKKEDGEEIYIHNSEDPADCANQAADLLGKMGKEGIAVLFGFGLGYFAEEILRRFETGHIMMIYEATPGLFRAALQTRDLSGLLESDKVKIVLGTDADSFADIHNYHHLIANGNFWIVKHHPSLRINEAAYNRLHHRLEEEKRLSDSGVGTIVSIGKEFVNALMANIPQIIRKQGVSKLKDIFKGRPAIIVSAGPSLEKNFGLLRKAKGRAVIIAVDVVLPTLLPAGIVPDILVAIDPMPSNIVVFRDIPVLRNVPFVCIAQYTPEIIDIYPGPVFINSVPQNVIYQWLSGLWEEKGYIDCFGGSVAHFAFGVAEYTGADTIALIGQDLSFEKKMHAGETSRLLAAFHKKKEPDHTKNGLEVDNIFGEKRYTLDTLLSFKTSFEKKIEKYQGKVINATEGGLPIKGATLMRLDDFINEDCDLQEIDTFSILSEITDGNVVYNLDALLAVVSEARDIFSNVKKNSNRVLKYIKRIKTLKEKGEKDSAESHNILAKIESLVEKVKHPALNLLVGYNYGLELFMKRQDMLDIDEIEDSWERLDKQLDRGSRYYKEIVKTINLFNKQLDRLYSSLKREKKVNTILFDESLAQRDKYSRAGLIYCKAGMASQAVRYLELAIAETDTYIPEGEAHDDPDRGNYSLRVSLAEMYLRQFRFYDAMEILKNVIGGQTTGSNKIEKLTDICEKKIVAWEDRKRKMLGLIEEAEANYGSSLDSGYFYFRIADYERAEKAYRNAIRQSSGNDETLVAAYYGLAHTYLATEDQEKAFGILEKALELDPSSPILYRDMGLISLQNNNTGPAELFFAKAIELAPSEPALYKPLADLYLSLGMKDSAISLYENALQVNADNEEMMRELAMLYKESVVDAQPG